MTSSGTAFAEREYNLRAAFPDHLQWFARWADDSERSRASMRVVRDVRYGQGPKQTVDLFPAQQPRGALLFIHGGYWRALDKDDHSFIAPSFVAEGIGVAVVNYDHIKTSAPCNSVKVYRHMARAENIKRCRR